MPRCDSTLRPFGLWILGLAASAALSAPLASAQPSLPQERPSEERLDPPTYKIPSEDRAPILPPYPIPQLPNRAGGESGVRIRISEIQFQGNTVLSDAFLDTLASPYLGRSLDYADLRELRDRITQAYVDRGYRTSGAVLPDQTTEHGLLVYRIIEGRIGTIEIDNDGRFRDAALRRKLRNATRGPVQVQSLEAGLRVLQQDRRIRKVAARLIPTSERGISTLALQVLEAPPVTARAVFDNHRSPAIGSLGGEISLGFDNLLGVGDEVFLRTGLSEGLRQFEGRLSAPISAIDTLLTFRFRWSGADVVEKPISDNFNLAARSRTIGVELRQPLYHGFETRLETFLRAELRRSKTTIDGVGISFASGPENGESKVSALRWGLEWTRRDQRQAVSLRSLLSVGLGILDSTSHTKKTPDGRFVSWLAQAHWARRIDFADSQLVARGEVQLANRALLPLEQFAIGGRYTVRGYRENTAVGDSGFIGSLEARIPLYTRVSPAVEWQAIPFVDVGTIWNPKRVSDGRKTLVSIGLGTRLSWEGLADFELFWGRALKRIDRTAPYDAQDDGLHFRVSMRWP